MAFGQQLVSLIRSSTRPKVIVALDHDFLGLDAPAPFFTTKLFARAARSRSEEDLDKMNRLYAVESQFSLTGANADHRLRMKGSDVRQFAVGFGGRAGCDAGSECGRQRRYRAIKRAKFLAALVKDLKAAGAEGAGGGRSAAAGQRACAGRADQSEAGQRRA